MQTNLPHSQVTKDMLTLKFRTCRLLACFVLLLVMVTFLIIFPNYNLAKGEAVFLVNLKRPNLATNSFVIKTREYLASSGIATYKSGYSFHNHRLRLWYGGRCIDSSDGKKLTVQFCDPDLKQVRFDNKFLR